ncbi:MAG: protein kinase [Planctomycetes bacterium]|nr:protein kinase [Planctomycetota bacterium]
MSDPKESRLIDLAVERGILSARQAEECRDVPKPVEWLMERKILSSNDVDDLERAITALLRDTEATRPAGPPPAKEPFPREFGAYTLLSELGRGGMGVVYRAVHKPLGRHVALKVLERVDEPGTGEINARFQREAQVMARLVHPNIVTIHDYGVHEDRPYIAMELVQGTSLDRHLKTVFPPREKVLSLLASVARALAYAHAQGVVHRDVKPANILVDAEGNARLADFGLAKTTDQKLTWTGALLGTPMYMSPEQAQGRTVDARSDLFSLGAVMYECITGAPPFTGTSIEAIVNRVARSDPVPPRVVEPGIPRDAENVCLKALAKDAAHRYASAQELADDLDRLVRGEPVLARPPSVLRRGFRSVLRHRLAAVSIAAAVLVAGSGLAAVLVLRSQLRDARTRAKEMETFRDQSKRAEEMAALAAEAEKEYRNGRYAEALALYERLGDPRPLVHAVCLAETGRRVEAEAAYRAYLDRFPSDAPAWRLRGLNALERPDWSTAVDSYSKAAELAHVSRAADARAAEEYDALVALVERHFLPLDPGHARPHLAAYDPTYLFQRRRPGPVVHGLSEWRETFPLEKFGTMKPEELDAWIARHGEHPVLLGWRAYQRQKGEDAVVRDLDRALSVVPISRWLRLARYLALRRMKREKASEDDRSALRVFCPRDPSIRLTIAKRLKEEGTYLPASREFESLYDDWTAGTLSSRWDDDYVEKRDLIFRAAACAALAGNAAETVRILGKAKAWFRKSDIVPNAEFRGVIASPEMKEFLKTLRE